VGKECDHLIPEMLNQDSVSITSDLEEISRYNHYTCICKCHYLTKRPSHGGMITISNVKKMQEPRSILASSSVRKF
jgi:hypothetical protein